MADLGPFHQNEGTPRPRARNLNKCVIIVQEHITPKMIILTYSGARMGKLAWNMIWEDLVLRTGEER